MTHRTGRQRHPFNLDPDDPVEIPADLPSHITPEDYAAWVLRRRTYQRIVTEFLRVFFDHYGVWRRCHRRGCRRAHRCTAIDLDCRDEQAGYVRATVYPVIRQALRHRRAEAGVAGAETPGDRI